MAKNMLKGLTIEIGGETTKLEKALEKVNKKAGDVSSELGAINKLLKMDPGNTDLLAQKQKVLAEAISNSREKLDQLREAEKQVQEQFKRGEVSEEQVRALQREVVAATKKLESYEKAAKETADEIKGLGEESKKTEKESGNLGESLKNVAKNGLAAVAAAAAAVVAGLTGAAESTREYRTEMGKLDTAFTTNGHTAESARKAYKDLQGVLGETDQAVETANHLAKLTENEKDLAQWTGDILPGVFATFGASLPIEGLTEAANETAKVGQVTGPLADALNWAGVSEDAFNESLAACNTEQERQTLIMETLTDLYSEASEKYKEVNAEVIRANEANEAWTASMAGVGGALEPILTDVKMLGADLLSDLVPGVQQLAEAFRGLLAGDAGAAGDIGAALSGVITGLLDKVTELAPTLVQVAISLITTLATTLISKIPELVVVAGELIVALINGIGAAVPQLVQAIVDMIPQLIAVLPDVIMSIVDALLTNLPIIIDGIIQLIMGIVGNLDEFVAAILPMIPQIITAVCDSLAENLPVIIDAVIQLVFMLITEVLPAIIAEIGKAIPQILEALLSGLGKIYTSLQDYFAELDAKLTDWFYGVVDKVKKWASDLWKRFTTWVGNLVKKAGEAASQFLNNIGKYISQLPSKVWNWLQNAYQKVVTWASNLVTKGKNAARELVSAVTNGIKNLPNKVKEIGGNLISGLWNGINNKLTWLKNKIKGFTDSVLSSIKNFFGVHSPARSSGNLKTTDWIGEMLDEGLAVGLDDNVGAPIEAAKRVSGNVLDAAANGIDGLSINKRLNGPTSSQAAAAAANGGLFDKLDRILSAIERGQVLTIDGDALVGATAARYDSQLGMRRALAARGAM